VSLLANTVSPAREPGPISMPADSARMDDYRGIAQLSYELHETDNARLEAALYSRQTWSHYWNPDTLAWINDTTLRKPQASPSSRPSTCRPGHGRCRR